MILHLFGGFLFLYKSISDKHEWLYSQYTVSSLEWTIKPKIIRKSRVFLIFDLANLFLRDLYRAKVVILLLISLYLFYGWSYWKNSNACKFVLTCRLIHKFFWLVRGPVFCPASGFCTSSGDINLKVGCIMQCSMRNSKMEFANHFS